MSCIATIIRKSLLASCHSERSEEPAFASTTSEAGELIVHIRIQLCLPGLRALRLDSNPFLLNIPHHIHDPFKNSYKILTRQRTSIHPLHIFKHNPFPLGLINRQTGIALQSPNLHCSLRPLAQQFHQSPIKLINLFPPICDIHERPGCPALARFSRRVGILNSYLPPVSFPTNSPTASASRPRFRSIVSTIALPTTTASANLPTSANCSAFEIPNPTATGNLVTRRSRRTNFCASSANCCRVPVTPVRDTAYTNPREASATRFNRASGLVGAARNTGAKSYAFTARKYSPDSSTGKSVTNTPSTPA